MKFCLPAAELNSSLKTTPPFITNPTRSHPCDVGQRTSDAVLTRLDASDFNVPAIFTSAINGCPCTVSIKSSLTASM